MLILPPWVHLTVVPKPRIALRRSKPLRRSEPRQADHALDEPQKALRNPDSSLQNNTAKHRQEVPFHPAQHAEAAELQRGGLQSPELQHNPDASTATVLHFVIPGDVVTTTAAVLPVDFNKGRIQGDAELAEARRDGARQNKQNGQASLGEAGSLSVDAKDSRYPGCSAVRWWAFGNPVAVYHLPQVRHCCHVVCIARVAHLWPQ
jgi:hypothetical protein